MIAINPFDWRARIADGAETMFTKDPYCRTTIYSSWRGMTDAAKAKQPWAAFRDAKMEEGAKLEMRRCELGANSTTAHLNTERWRNPT